MAFAVDYEVRNEHGIFSCGRSRLEGTTMTSLKMLTSAVLMLLAVIFILWRVVQTNNKYKYQ